MAAVRQTTRSCVLPAGRTRAWGVLTDPATASTWLGGTGSVALRVPGSHGVLTEPDGTLRQLVVERVEAEHRVVLRWWTDRGPGVEPSIVEIELDDARGGTSVTVTETALADHVATEGVR